MKEYRIVFRAKKTGDWYFPARPPKTARVFRDKAEAIQEANRRMADDQLLAYPLWDGFKIMEREVTEWTDETEDRRSEFGKPNVNAYWEHVKSVYPFAVFDFWYRIGELHFYPDRDAMRRGDDPYGCIMEDGKYVIYQRF